MNERIADIGFGVDTPILNTDQPTEEIVSAVTRLAGRIIHNHEEFLAREDEVGEIPGFRMTVLIEPGINASNGFNRINKIHAAINDYVRERGYALSSSIQELIPASRVAEALGGGEYSRAKGDWVLYQQFDVVNLNRSDEKLNSLITAENGERGIRHWAILLERLLEQDRKAQRIAGLAQFGFRHAD